MNYLPDINELKGKYKGRRAFLLGNGPSLENAPFDKLKNAYTFGMNRIGWMFQFTDWRPTFFVGMSSVLRDASCAHYHQDFYSGMDRAEIAFLWDWLNHSKPLKIILGTRSNIIYLRASEATHLEPEDVDINIWSDNIAKRVSKYGTSMLAAIQIAAYMGFNPLYFIGMDGHYKEHDKEHDPNHFGNTYRGHPYQTDFEAVNKGHEKALTIAKEALDARNIKAYDLTQAKGWGIFPKKKLEDIL